MKTNITYLGIPLIVDYRLEGIYRAATYLEPEEKPIVSIRTICAEDSEIDLQNILDWRDIEKIVGMIEEKEL
ncbi:MAG TPA: hypothetical protein VLA48_03555 [Nitrososphaeraceae archaeon]|nr:hypothetical protein [Nitrososphaeraceae archaeon]